MKAIVINAGATVQVITSHRNRMRCEAMSLKQAMRLDAPPWTYKTDDGITLVISKGPNFAIYANSKDVGLAYT